MTLTTDPPLLAKARRFVVQTLHHRSEAVGGAAADVPAPAGGVSGTLIGNFAAQASAAQAGGYGGGRAPIEASARSGRAHEPAPHSTFLDGGTMDGTAKAPRHVPAPAAAAPASGGPEAAECHRIQALLKQNLADFGDDPTEAAAKRALIYWADEVFCQTRLKGTWEDQSLEFQLLGRHNRGVNFFVDAAQAVQDGLAEAAAVFLMCLSLRFRGVFSSQRTVSADMVSRHFGRSDVPNSLQGWADMLSRAAAVGGGDFQPARQPDLVGDCTPLDWIGYRRRVAGVLALVVAVTLALALAVLWTGAADRLLGRGAAADMPAAAAADD